MDNGIFGSPLITIKGNHFMTIIKHFYRRLRKHKNPNPLLLFHSLVEMSMVESTFVINRVALCKNLERIELIVFITVTDKKNK